ncbi:MAG: transporter related [Phycisphaerales bacterium]|nr:transporter related [Phycisphaerales bacterium]MDB5358351.1 transporter related [Phycisphaerales bacterium]
MSLNISKLKKSYRSPDGQSVPVIDLPSLTLEDGEQVALIGGSGCGKTTLLHLIAGILAADSGRIEYSLGTEGVVEIGGLSESQRDVFRGRHVGYVYQTHHLLPGFTALENVLLGMSFTGRAHDPAWAKRLLGEVGLSERLHYKPQKLSVGQQQRVAVARALANRPKLVLADEPTGALDPRTAQQVLELIRNLCREVNASLLLVSHDPAIARQLSRTLALTEINQAVGVARGEPAGAAA